MALDAETKKTLIAFQRNEITEHLLYGKLADKVPGQNGEILRKISADELRHYDRWRAHTHEEIRPSRGKILFYYLISRILGFTFGIKLMERGEENAQLTYVALRRQFPEDIDLLIREEKDHEDSLIAMLDEEKLRYTGSIVLGLSDALVELTGALAGFTLALRNTSLIAVTGLITGIAAALSMASSEYLSTKAEGTDRQPLRASIYTGIVYLVTVSLLVLPYLILKNYYVCLAATMITAVLIIAFFNYYISVAQDLPFRKRFFEMAGLCLGVAAISFAIGYAVRIFLGVDT